MVIARLSVDGSGFWVQQDDGAGPEGAGGGPVRMILSVDDPDTAFARALAAGATEVAAVHESHGWRTGRVADPYGYHRYLARRL